VRRPRAAKGIAASAPPPRRSIASRSSAAVVPTPPRPRRTAAPGDSRAARTHRQAGSPGRGLGNDAAGGQRDGVLAERGLVVIGQAGRAQRERTAERAAQVIALRQLARVICQQLTGYREEGQLQGSEVWHEAKYTGPAPSSLDAAAPLSRYESAIYPSQMQRNP
jgi:hypothetical protein